MNYELTKVYQNSRPIIDTPLLLYAIKRYEITFYFF